jgi:hypothetical protein
MRELHPPQPLEAIKEGAHGCIGVPGRLMVAAAPSAHGRQPRASLGRLVRVIATVAVPTTETVLGRRHDGLGSSHMHSASGPVLRACQPPGTGQAAGAAQQLADSWWSLTK